MRVVISYDHRDGKHADRLEKDLKDQNIGIWIDKSSIKPGMVLLREIDKALYQEDFVLGIVTENYIDSIGGIEAYAKIWEGLLKKKEEFIPLFFEPPEKIPSPVINLIRGINFSDNYNDGLLELITFLKSEELEKAKEILSKVEGSESRSPFRRVRTELFRDDYKLLGQAFAEPEKEKYELISGDAPVFIFGGRGSGKTMILKSLTPFVVTSRLGVSTFKEAKEKGVDFFGIYFKLKKGSLNLYESNTIVEMGFLLTGQKKDYELYKELIEKLKSNQFEEIEKDPILSNGLNAASNISLNEMNYKILRTIIEELKKIKDTNSPILHINKAEESDIAKKVAGELKTTLVKNIKNFDDLIRFINLELQKIEDYLQKLTIPHTKPIHNWIPTGTEFLDKIFDVIKNNIRELNGVMFNLLFDEFENLRFFQQTIINEWVKTAKNFVVKVSSKFEGMYTNMTFQKQALQFGQDCQRWDLDYDLFDNKSQSLYQKLLVKICENLLKIEGYKEIDIRKILEVSKAPELPQDEIDEEIKKIRESGQLEFKPERLDEYRNKLQIATIFRLLRKKEKVVGRKSRKKTYAGFEVFTYLSSGIIRIFLNLVGIAFYRAEEEGIDIKKGGKVSIDHQSWAARVVSKAWLERIPTNLDLREHGETMYQFIVDIGDIFRERLLYHTSEPETLTISLSDVSSLKKPSNFLIQKLLTFGVKESVFYRREETSAYYPKHTNSIRPREFVLNRVYAPLLELSYRARWGRCEFACYELADLLDESRRKMIKKKLQLKQRGKSKLLENVQPLLKYTSGENEKKS